MPLLLTLAQGQLSFGSLCLGPAQFGFVYALFMHCNALQGSSSFYDKPEVATSKAMICFFLSLQKWLLYTAAPLLISPFFFLHYHILPFFARIPTCPLTLFLSALPSTFVFYIPHLSHLFVLSRFQGRNLCLLRTMSSKSADEERRRSKADKQLEVALHSGLPEDSSGIDSNPVYKKLAPTSEAKYASVFEFWKA